MMASSLSGKKRKSPCSVFPGLQFHPTDRELIGHYLAKKVRGGGEKENEWFYNPGCIHEANVYEFHPSELVDAYAPALGTEEWYFFTHRERKYANGKRPNRRASTGSWKATGSFPDVTSVDGKKLGNKRSLVYYEDEIILPDQLKSSPPSKKGTKTNWLMQEFVLLGHPDSLVCCKIYYHGKGPNSATSTASDRDQYQQQQQQQLVPHILGSLQSAQFVPDQSSDQQTKSAAAAEFTSLESTTSDHVADITLAARDVPDHPPVLAHASSEPSPPVLVIDPISTQLPSVLADHASFPDQTEYCRAHHASFPDQTEYCLDTEVDLINIFDFTEGRHCLDTGHIYDTQITAAAIPLDTYAPESMFVESHASLEQCIVADQVI